VSDATDTTSPAPRFCKMIECCPSVICGVEPSGPVKVSTAGADTLPRFCIATVFEAIPA
jgi:hypothetical protein